jgi:hypothetical protein
MILMDKQKKEVIQSKHPVVDIGRLVLKMAVWSL